MLCILRSCYSVHCSSKLKFTPPPHYHIMDITVSYYKRLGGWS